MRQSGGHWHVAPAGWLAVSLLWTSAWAQNDVNRGGRRFADSKSGQIETAGSQEPVYGLESPGVDFSEPGSNPSGIDPNDKLVWDNGFAHGGGFSMANQCQTLDCGEPGSSPLALVADDILLAEGTIVRAFKSRVRFRNPAVRADLLGVYVFFWKDDGSNGPDIPSNALEPGLGSPVSDGPRGPGRFLIKPSDPGFSIFDEGPGNLRLEVSFNAGEQWISPGVPVWISMVPILASPPQTFTAASQFPLARSLVQSLQPEDPANPWTDPDPGILPFDTQFQLFGQFPKGGTTIVTISESAGVPAGCDVSLLVRQEPLSDCTPGRCNTGALGATCQASYTTQAGDTASDVAAGLVDNFRSTACAGRVRVTMAAIGPRILVTTDDGARPLICLGGDNGDLIGGPHRCEANDACSNLFFRVGLNDTQVLPPIEPGIDQLTTVKDCPNTNDGVGTWMEIEFPAGMFDRPGLPPSKTLSTRRIAFSGVARPFANDDSDTTIERLDAMFFGLCSGDFIDTGHGGSTSPNSDGKVDSDDAESFAACRNNIGIGDCVFFDYDNDGDIDADDGDVLDCLLRSGNSIDCCPPTFNGDSADPSNYPQTATTSGLALRRLHLRSCEPLVVEREGQNDRPEYWWIDHYLSDEPPSVRAGSLGDCVVGDLEPNNVTGNADDLGFVGRGRAVRVMGSISDTRCDRDIPAQCHRGQRDDDVYLFTVAFTEFVNITARARGTADACDGIGNNCLCDADDLAVPSLWLYSYDAQTLSSSFLDHSDPVVPPAPLPGQEPCDPIIDSTIDPVISRVLDAGTYAVVVASAGQYTVPRPDNPDKTGCAIEQGLCVPNNDEGPTTGNYELNITVVEGSTITVTQTNAHGGTFDSRLLVQSLTTFSRVGDPFATVMIDSGELGEAAVTLFTNDAPWVNQLNPADVDTIPGDPRFIPGLSADVKNVQTAVPIQYVDVDIRSDPAEDADLATVTHLLQPPRALKCNVPAGFDPRLVKDVARGSWRTMTGEVIRAQPFAELAGSVGTPSDRNVDRQVADNFTLLEDTTITDIHWRGFYETNTPEITLPRGDRFTIQLWTDDGGVPGSVVKIYGRRPDVLTNADVTRLPGELSGNPQCPGRTVYEYRLDLGPNGLNDPIEPSDFPGGTNANTRIWMSIINDTTGSSFNWSWAHAGGGDSDGMAASRDIGGLWNPQSLDFSFDLTVEGTTKIINGYSINGTGLGYRFDPRFCRVNGIQPLSDEEAIHWRNVAASWESYELVDVTPVPPGQAQEAFDEAGIAIEQEELDALTANVSDEKVLVAVFSGLGDFGCGDGHIAGRIDLLCNGGIVDRVDPNDNPAERHEGLIVKGICWNNGLTTFLTAPTTAPFIVHGGTGPGKTIPCSGYIDPRLESDDGIGRNRGVDTITLVFSEPVQPVGGGSLDGCLTCFEVTETGIEAPPGVRSVSTADNITVDVTLDRLMTFNEWTTLRAIVENAARCRIQNFENQGPQVAEPDRIDIGRLPGEINQDGQVTPQDLIVLRQFLTGGGFHNDCADLLYFDIDRDGVMPEPQDLIRFRQMMAGQSPATQSWTLEQMNTTQP